MKSRLALACLALSCASPTTESARPGRLPAPSHEPAAAAPNAAAPSSTRPAPATTLITEPAVLEALERRGLSLGALLGAHDAKTNDSLSRAPVFAPLVATLEEELVRVAASDKLAGVDMARFSHRLFDRRFFRLPQAWFALAGVVNRLDRAAYDANSCGETRLIYRLSYALDAERASKLPMTLGVEVKVPRGHDCVEAVARWQEPVHPDTETRAGWLRSPQGPLAPPLMLVSHETTRVVINLQLVRWPSTVRPDLGGHAEYLLRAYRPGAAGALEPERLENTIDPADFRTRLQQAELLRWLAENAAGVDAGTALLPQRFLAKRAISVTPRGLSRLANRPFSAALSSSAFSSRDFTTGRFVKSTAGLLRRLDQLSCQGCHEAQSVAGFHLLGEDLASAPVENALALPFSPHLAADLARRAHIAELTSRGETADLAVPFAERPTQDGRYGAPCGLGGDPSFTGWTCDEGLQCTAGEARPGDPVGQCLSKTRQVGDGCELGAVTRNADPHRDRMGHVRVEPCPGMVCNRSRVGFPGGMCTAQCGSPGATCGVIAILEPFNTCLARGESFLSCVRGNTSPAGLRACSVDHPCRDDYVCARSASGGACLPPYFVFQLRVDGHSSSLR